jgi:hypothetical protein
MPSVHELQVVDWLAGADCKAANSTLKPQLCFRFGESEHRAQSIELLFGEPWSACEHLPQ